MTMDGSLRVFLIDDEENMSRILGRILSREGYAVTTFADPREALARIDDHPPDILITDISMPEVDGMAVLAHARRAAPATIVLLMTAYGTIDGAIRALKEGAFDYLTKPFDTQELIEKVARAADALRAYRASSEALRQPVEAPAPAPGVVEDWEMELQQRLPGASAAMAKVRGVIMKVAATDSCVLIRGESGTGKELVARAIHDTSARAARRMVPINCAAIPEGLIESELFGHEPGAFTGAVKRKLGLIEAAQGGTLFLDEIGELPLNVQGRLLRVLQDHQVQRLGGIEPIDVDVRIIAATNRDLEQMVREGTFRPDLFYRLNVIRVALPPLRERKEDIPMLSELLARRIGLRKGRALEFDPEVIARFVEHGWPGNVRELENVIERLLVLADDGRATLQMLPLEVQTSSAAESGLHKTPLPAQFRDARDQFERRYLSDLLRKSGGSITEAARLSGISRRNLYDKIEKLSIDLDQFKRG